MSEIICYCKNISRKEVLSAIKNGAKNIEDIRWSTGACTGNKCEELNPTGKCCSANIKEIIIAEHGGLHSNCSCCS